MCEVKSTTLRSSSLDNPDHAINLLHIGDGTSGVRSFHVVLKHCLY